MNPLENPLPKPDHDLLIALHTKMDDVARRVDDLGDDMKSRIIQLENRANLVDLYHAKIPLEEMTVAFNWLQRLRANIALLGIVGTLFMAVIIYIIDGLFSKWFKF